MKCPKCNHEINSAAVFCGYCGSEIKSSFTPMYYDEDSDKFSYEDDSDKTVAVRPASGVSAHPERLSAKDINAMNWDVASKSAYDESKTAIFTSTPSEIDPAKDMYVDRAEPKRMPSRSVPPVYEPIRREPPVNYETKKESHVITTKPSTSKRISKNEFFSQPDDLG